MERMIPVLVVIVLFCALYWALMAGHGLAPKVSIRRRPKPEPERLMTRWSIWLLERELEVPTDEPDVVMAAINARLNESEDISSDELADMRRASEVILRESTKRLRLETAKLRLLLPPTARKEWR